MQISFSKYQGTGNDFVIVDDRSSSFPIEDVKFIGKLCHRKYGIGADGVVLLQESEKADFRSRIFNCNGFEAKSCGNGICCLTRFISDLGFSEKEYTIETMNRIVKSKLDGDGILVDLGEPILVGENVKLPLKKGILHFHLVETGVPHAVIFVEDVKKIDVKKLGKEIRMHPLFQPDGVNVDFVSQRKDGTLEARVFEKGVERETLGCGTGATAVGALAAKRYELSSPIPIAFRGGTIEIYFQRIANKPQNFKMKGSASFIFSGTFHVGEKYANRNS